MGWGMGWGSFAELKACPGERALGEWSSRPGAGTGSGDLRSDSGSNLHGSFARLRSCSAWIRPPVPCLDECPGVPTD